MKLLKRFSLFEILLILVILGIHLYAATADAYTFPNAWFIRDDAYYYFKVAQNITQGLGSTFDGINPTNGYHPLWLVICIPIFILAQFDLILPLRVLLMVIAVFNAATAILLYRVMSRSLSNAVAMLAASFWAFNDYIHYAIYRQGLESPLAAFAVILFIERLANFESRWRKEPVTAKQIAALASIAVIVMFSRLDLIFLAVIAGIYIIFRGRPLRFLLPLDIAAIFISLPAAFALRLGFPLYNSYAESALTAVIIALVIKLIVFYFTGLYQHPNGESLPKLIQRIALGTTLGAAISSGGLILLGELGMIGGFPRSALLLDWAITSALILILRLCARWFGNPNPQPSASPVKELLSQWKTWLAEGLTYYGVAGGALAVYMLINKILFNTSSPVSGQIKRWWGTLLHTVYDKPASNWAEFLGIGFGGPYDTWAPLSHALMAIARAIKPLYPGSNTEDERYYIVLFIFVLLLMIVFAVNAKRALHLLSKMTLLPLAASVFVQSLSYTATAYGGAKEWYWVSQIILIVFGLGIFLDLLIHPLQKINTLRTAINTAATALGVVFVLVLGNFIAFNMRHGYFPSDRPYMEVVAYLEENTQPDSVIGMTGGGNVGYFIKDRTIVNMDGLINSYDYFQALKKGEAAVYLRQHEMTIVFANSNILTYPPYNSQFDPYLQAFNTYGGKRLMWLLAKPKYAP